MAASATTGHGHAGPLPPLSATRGRSGSMSSIEGEYLKTVKPAWFDRVHKTMATQFAGAATLASKNTACSATLDRLCFESRCYAPLIGDIKQELDDHIEYHESKRRMALTDMRKSELEATNVRNRCVQLVELSDRLAVAKREKRRLSAQRNWLKLLHCMKRSKQELMAEKAKHAAQESASGLKRLVSRMGAVRGSSIYALKQELEKLKKVHHAFLTERHQYQTTSFRHSLQENLQELEDRIWVTHEQLATRLEDILVAAVHHMKLAEDSTKIIRMTVKDRLKSVAASQLSWIDKFERSFAQHRYEEACGLAVTCPDRLLRTQKTWRLFWRVSEEAWINDPQGHEKINVAELPIVMYCAALIDNNVDESESLQCVAMALEYHQIDCLEHWIISGQLKVTDQVVDLLLAHQKWPQYKYKLIMLAVWICQRSDSARSRELGIELLLRQGKPQAALQFGRQRGVTVNDFLRIAVVSGAATSSMVEFLGTSACHSNKLQNIGNSFSNVSEVVHTCEDYLSILSRSIASEVMKSVTDR